MLSEQEYQDIQHQLNNITATGKYRQQIRRPLLKKLKEHEYATRFAPFEPLPHIPFFINRTTPEPILRQIIQAATTSAEFIIDTESINIYKSRNEPALIQIQIILPHNYSLALIVEVCHLPNVDHIRFILIKELIQILFLPNKIIYIWGSKHELNSFSKFGLFSNRQVQHIRSINLQTEFKKYWAQQHPHTPSSISINKCLCEKCLGKISGALWSLQDAVAYELEEYLSKQLTMEAFDIGLDPTLHYMNDEQKYYREQLSKYALNDCFSMHKITINMNNKNFKFTFEMDKKIPSDLLELMSSPDNDETITSIHFNSPFTPSTNNPSQQPIYEPISDEDDNNEHETPQLSTSISRISTHSLPVREELSEAERRKIHNRSCTLRQRRRYYRHEIIRRNIDGRFTYTQVKNILRQLHIPFNIINISQSKITHKYSLYIGIRNPSKLHTYQRQTRPLFTTEHYHELQSLRRSSYSYHHRRPSTS